MACWGWLVMTRPLSPVVIIVAIAACLLASVRGTPLVVDGQRLVNQLLELAKFSDHPNPAVTRVVFTPNDLLGRSFVKQLMGDAGLGIREDAVGNIFGRWEGSDAGAAAVLTGSHTDAIPWAGAYDGTLGVIGAIEAMLVLKKAGYQPKRSLEVLMFTSEEPTRFGLGCIGSRIMAGALTPKVLDSSLDESGASFLQAAKDAGYGEETTQAMLQAALVPEGRYSHFVELHIEQGPLLEAEGFDIGIVTAIAAPAALNVEFTGTGGHAGALLMKYRNDAALAGAELALAVEKHVLATGAEDTVGTTGVFELSPGAVNSVPRKARMGIDIRDIDGERRDSVVEAVLADAKEIAARRKVGLAASVVNQDPPAICNSEILAAIVHSAAALKLSTKHMVSRAYHDSLFMARIAPTAMIFIPCKNGYSHRPDEFSAPHQIANGVGVLALTMAELSGGTWGEAGATKTEL